MVVKQANITSYKVSDPGEILDRRPVLSQHFFLNIFPQMKRDAYLKYRWDRTPCKKLYLLVSPPFIAPFDPFFFMESSF